jgi:hypothetical protein
MSNTDEMSDEQMNRFFHETVLGKCWHKPVRDQTRLGNVIICRKCKEEFPRADILSDVRNPAYSTSLDLIALVEKVAIKRFGARAYGKKLVNIVLELIVVGTGDYANEVDLTFDQITILATAPPDVRAKALRSLAWEGEGT